jgi:Flp pilus assembly protein TadG
MSIQDHPFRTPSGSLIAVRDRLLAFAARLRTANSGVATIELAVIVPVMGVLLLSTLDMGMLVYREMDLRNAARVGAQYAFQDSTAYSTMQSTAVNALGPQPSGVAAASATATASCECPTSTENYTLTTSVPCSTTTCTVTGTKPSSYITVTITQAYSPMFGSWSLFSSHTLSGTATLRVN